MLLVRGTTIYEEGGTHFELNVSPSAPFMLLVMCATIWGVRRESAMGTQFEHTMFPPNYIIPLILFVWDAMIWEERGAWCLILNKKCFPLNALNAIS